jgi:hypothetical protein
MSKTIWLDRKGWPMEFITGRPVLNFVRWLLWASLRKTISQRGRWQCIKGYGQGAIVDTWCKHDNIVFTKRDDIMLTGK